MHSVETMAHAAQKKVNTVVERIDFLEKNLVPTVIEKTNASLQSLRDQLVDFGDFLNALIDSVGAESIKEIVTKTRKDRALAKIETQKQELASMIERGTLVEAQKVGRFSIVAGTVKDTDGNDVFPGWEVVAVASQPEDIKTLLIDAEKLSELKLPNGNTFVVSEVYDAKQESNA